MKIGFLTRYDVNDKTAWSGIINFFYETLKKDYDVYPIVFKNSLFKRLLQKAVCVATGRKNTININGIFFKIKVNIKIKKARNLGIDVFFAPVASEMLGVLKAYKDLKIIYLSDATYHLMLDYYIFDENKHEIKKQDKLERNSLKTATDIIYSSDWARSDAINYYGVNKNKIQVLPFGANLDDRYMEHSIGDTVKILFVGVDRIRKGADIAIECVNILNKKNYEKKFELMLVGFEKPEEYTESDEIHFAGRLNKNNPDEYEQMIKYYKESNIFLLPTKAECAGVVFSEAAMYGLPVFTHDTGGVMTYVDDMKTGRGLKLGATPEDFADAILDMFSNNKYEEWSRNARKKYESELNWGKWFEKFKSIAEKG